MTDEQVKTAPGSPAVDEGATTTCPGCAKPLEQGASRCRHCGLALGEHQRCPHCHSISDVAANPETKFVCTVCGGVRIPIDDPHVVRSPEQLELLKRVTLARAARNVWRAIAMVAAAFSLFSMLVLWLVISVVHPPVLGAAASGLAAVVPLAFAFVASRKASSWNAQLSPTLERAWHTAVADIGRSSSVNLSATRLSELTRIPEKEAARLLAKGDGRGAKVGDSGPLSQ